MSASGEYTEEELDEIWNGLSDEEQQEILSDYSVEDDGVDEWGDLSAEQKESSLSDYGHLTDDSSGEDGSGNEEPQGRESTMVDGAPLSIQEELTMVGENDTGVVVGDIEIPGATTYRRRAEGRESSYLREIQTGGDGENTYNADNPPEDGGDDSSSGDSGGSGEEPPITIIIEGRVAYNTLNQLRDLREQDETFTVEVDGFQLQDMELVEIDHEITGENPYDLAATIEVREWREYEVDTPGSGSGGDGDYGQDPDSDEGDPEELSDVEESGSPDEPNEITLGEGESRTINLEDGDRLRNVNIDATADGADVDINTEGDNWEIRDVSIEGDSGDEPAINASTNEEGNGTIEDVMINGEPAETDGGGQTYDVITVGTGETFSKSLSDGEVWSNKIIDITADGAGFNITAVADNWVIKNIGIRGQIDQGGAPSSQNFVVRVNSPGATGEITNFYHPGTSYARSYTPYPSGLFVHAYHEGDLEINNFYAKDLPSHAIYGSGPGNPPSHGNPGGNGAVRIHDSFTRDNENSGWRIGTDESYVQNSVAFRTTRGVWAYYNNPSIYNCDLGQNGNDIYAGNGSWGNTGTVTVENSRYDPNNVYTTGGGSISGSPVGSPEEYVPEGCPTTPEEAASGGGSGTGGGGTGDPDNGGQLYDNYTEVTASGQTETISDGQVYENVLVDLSSGSDFTVDARNATNWTIRNIGFKGACDGGNFLILCSDDSGNTSRVENVYMADGATDGNTDPGAIYLGTNHNGHIDFVCCNVQGWPNNGYYCSNGNGTVRFENCYGEDNGIATFRCAGDELVNCVGFNNDDTTNSNLTGRPVWAWSEEAVIQNSDFHAGNASNALVANDDGGSITMESGGVSGGTSGDVSLGRDVSDSPDLYMPHGVPRTPVEAAAGGAGAGGTDSPSEPESPSDYGAEVITLDRDEHRTIDVGDSGTLENVVYNITRNGASVTIQATGSDWTIRNVGIKGPQAGDNRTLVVEDTGGESTIENVYLGDGVAHHPADDQPAHGIYVTDSHTGHISMSNVHVYGARDHGIHAVNGSGSVSIENSYTRDCLQAHYRVANGSLTNCVAYNEDNNRSGRCLHVEPHSGTTTIDTCDFAGGEFEPVLEIGEPGATTNVEFENTHYTGGATLERGTVNWSDAGGNGNSPQSALPEGVPVSAEMAATDGKMAPDATSEGPVYTGPSEVPGIYVDPERHRGNVEINRVHIRGYPSGIIADDPNGDGGWVTVKNSYFTAIDGVNIQIGSASDNTSEQ